MAARTQHRPKLAIDLGEQVSKDLLIKPVTHGVTATPGITASSGVKAAGGITASQAVQGTVGIQQALKGIGISVASIKDHHRAIRTHRPPIQLVESLRAKIEAALPKDGEAIYTITHDFGGLRVGEVFKNWNEAFFWLGSEYQLKYSIDEWMNAEYEWVCDSLYDREESIGHPNHPGYSYAPAAETCLEAWDAVAYGHTDQLFMVPIHNKEGIPINVEQVPAGEIMSWFGIDHSVIVPILIIADRVLTHDLIAIENDEEVTLDNGNYMVKEVELDGEVAVFHIEPK